MRVIITVKPYNGSGFACKEEQLQKILLQLQQYPRNSYSITRTYRGNISFLKLRINTSINLNFNL